MTLPDERARAVLNTQAFLRRLLDPKLTPRVPKAIREEAYRCLRHYPGAMSVRAAAKGAPTVFELPEEDEDV
jgi:hypothetical protein